MKLTLVDKLIVALAVIVAFAIYYLIFLVVG